MDEPLSNLDAQLRRERAPNERSTASSARR
jgi:ABC-type sugar transport system ATPase subunit